MWSRRWITKRYDIAEVFAPWGSWQRAGSRTRVARAASPRSSTKPGTSAWCCGSSTSSQHGGAAALETSNVNVPGVRAYERLGYALRGVDAHYYGDYMPGESAIYLAKSL